MSIYWHFYWFSLFFISLILPSSTMRFFCWTIRADVFAMFSRFVDHYMRLFPMVTSHRSSDAIYHSSQFATPQGKKLFSCQNQESGSLNLQWASAGGKSRKQPKQTLALFTSCASDCFANNTDDKLDQQTFDIGRFYLCFYRVIVEFFHFLTLLLHVYLNMILLIFRGERE